MDEQILRDMFEDNFRYLRENAGHTINENMKQNAYKQVLCYYRKNKAIIDQITRAEVKLSLPEQQTPNQKIPYTIEGVVDIVREGDETWLYDLKTHDPERIQAEPEKYKEQLNVYAHIWKGLQKNELDGTAIIATPIPNSLKKALDANDESKIQKEFDKWEPVIPFGYNEDEVAEMIERFGKTVEHIENADFAPTSVEKLQSKMPGMKSNFATHVCRNCDVRYSCSSYTEYLKNSRSATRSNMLKYMGGNPEENEEFIEGNLNED
ncbi:MAG: PD-(D/E)XK nuclease family protein [Fibrobacter sp.]|nr:PD-(D/E)XK nuclease family protein [Fibrobacter sp.]